MSLELLSNRLESLRETERLKDALRSTHTSPDCPGSTAEYSWRLCLMALTFEDQLAGLNPDRVLCMYVIHDLGRAIHGGIPAVEQAMHPDRDEQGRVDLLQLTRHLDTPLRGRLLALQDEYERGETVGALAVEMLSKLKTPLQRTQGSNPTDFDYAFNLDYDRRYTDRTPLFKTLRELLDARTQQHLAARRDAQRASTRAALPAPPPTQLAMATGKRLARFLPARACLARLNKGVP